MNRISIIVLGDFLAFWVSFFLILLVRFWGPEYWMTFALHLIPFTILYFTWAFSFFLFGLYDIFSIKPTIPHLNRFGIALLFLFVIGIFLFYFAPIFGITPKTNLLFQVLGFGIFSLVLRRSIYVLFSKQITRPVVLVGNNPYITTLKETINQNPQLGLVIASHTQDAHTALREHNDTTHTIFIIEQSIETLSKEDITRLYENKTEVIDVAEAYERYLYKIPVEYISQAWILEHVRTRRDALMSLLGRLINVTIAVSILILSSPLLFVTAISIPIGTPGPILIKQKRVGKNRKLFTLYKFRSMFALAPDGSAEQDGAEWVSKQDSRITRIGAFLRKTHIDEIPQMINIITGDLALIGPRPERPEFVEKLEQTIPHYELRHIIRPGFTGWAQIKYRYARTIDDSKEKYEYDLYYIKNRNVFLDFGILLRTIQIIFTH